MTCKHLFPFLAAGMLLFSCSDDNDSITEGKDVTDGKAYVHFSINLPSTSAVGRANDDFADGTPSEYAVTSAHLVTFIGTSEANATVSEVVELLNLKPWFKDDNNQVTTKAHIVAEVYKKAGDAQKLYALVVLNANQTVLDKFSTGTSFMDLCGEKGEVDNIMVNDSKIVMMNAPLAFVSGTSKIAKTLVEIGKDDVCTSASAANAKEPLDIYVERGVAKVTMKKSATDNYNKFSIPVNNEGAIEVVVDPVAWAFDNGNTKSYLVHNVSDFDEWIEYEQKPARFYGSKPISDLENDIYHEATRIYWAVDPNYERDVADGELTRITTTDGEGWNSGDDAFDTKAIYVLENTFTTKFQKQNNTSRILIKCQIKKSASATPENLYRVGSSAILYDEANLKNLVINVAKTATGKDFQMIDGTLSVSKTAGKQKDLLSADDFKETKPTSEQLTAINNALGTIDTYLNGECYYDVLIRHFDDEQTPWSANDNPDGPIYGNPESDSKYLGRYGMVRNNWYELSIDGITSIGSSVIPTPDDIPDDEVKSYINVSCKILSWAKRNQKVTL